MSRGTETVPRQWCPGCCAEKLDTHFLSVPCTDTAGAGGSKSQVCALSQLQAGVGSHPLGAQLSLDPGCQSPFPKPCTCHPLTQALVQPPNTEGIGARRAEAGMALEMQCPPRATRLLSLGTLCLRFICVPGTQLLSNWIKLSQDAGIAPLTRAVAGLCPWGALCQARWPHNTQEGTPMTVRVFLGDSPKV